MNYETLEKKIDKDLNWRRREFIELSFIFNEMASEYRKKIILKSIITLSYANWEGYIKYCVEQYLEYINKKNLLFNQLKNNFKQISLGKHFKNNNKYNFEDIKTQKKFYEFFMENNEVFKINQKRMSENIGNLNYDAIKKILMQLGFPEDLYCNELGFIDEQLVKHRNNIAHGEKKNEDDIDFEMIYGQIKVRLLNMMQLFHDKILEYAKNEKFLIGN